MNFYQYGTDGQTDLPPFEPNLKLNDPALYMPSPGLQDAVNVALALGLPLLLTGEPGTGKTQLAYHVAWRFKLGEPIVFNAQTSSTAKDLFYSYDALGHFQYNQNSASALTPQEIEDRFIAYQAIGKAIISGQRQVVLIDEIDKAPRDLPNNVLAAIESLKFDVVETGMSFQTSFTQRPIIILTSNSEKNLPDAFLRRVVYFHIEFPDANRLLSILNTKIDGYNEAELKLIIAHFEAIRSSKRLKLRKPPATAELIAWSILLKRMNFNPALLGHESGLSEGQKEKLKISYSVLAKTKEDLALLHQSVED